MFGASLWGVGSLWFWAGDVIGSSLMGVGDLALLAGDAIGASLMGVSDFALRAGDAIDSFKTVGEGSLKLNSSARSTIIFEINGEFAYLFLGVDLLSFEFSFSRSGNS